MGQNGEEVSHSGRFSARDSHSFALLNAFLAGKSVVFYLKSNIIECVQTERSVVYMENFVKHFE